MKKVNLLNCPCCGGKAEFCCDIMPVENVDCETGICNLQEDYCEWVECLSCGLVMSSCFNEGEAVEKWNKRNYSPIPLSECVLTEGDEFVLYGERGGTTLCKYIDFPKNGFYGFKLKNQKNGVNYISKENVEDIYVIPIKKITKRVNKDD